MNIKRIAAGVAALTLVWTAFGGTFPECVKPYQASAAGEVYTSGDWQYEKISDGIKLVKYTGGGTDFRIPGEIDGQKVTEISAHIFEDCPQKVTSIQLEDENIRFDGNLLEFSDVTTVTVLFHHYEEGVDINPKYSFNRTDMGGGNCLRLSNSRYSGMRYTEKIYYDWDEEFVYEYNMGIEERETFYEMIDGEPVPKKIDLVVPGNVAGADVVSIGCGCFNCSEVLDSIKLPDTICIIEEFAFDGSSIRKINIPENVKIIPGYCFNSCTELEEIDMPDGLIGIGLGAFQNTKFEEKYTSFELSNGREINVPFVDWTVKLKINNDFSVTAMISSYNGFDEIVEFPLEVHGYPVDYSSYNTSSVLPQSYYDEEISVREVRFPEALTSIPRIGGSSLEKVVFPKAITEIPEYGLERSWRLKEITIPENIRTIGSFAFNCCQNLENVTIESDSIFIDGHAFWDTAVRELELPGNCKLGNHCISGKLESVSFGPGDCVELTSGALMEIPTLKTVSFSPDIKKIIIGERALSGTGISTLELDSRCSKIGVSAFSKCKDLISVKISGAAPIEDEAFKADSVLQKVTLSGKHSIGKEAFADCTSLTSFDFDEEPVLSPDTFSGCTALNTINSIRVIKGDETEFPKELDAFIRKNFEGAENIGFIDKFIMNKVKAVVAEVTDESMSDIEKAKALHDWLCDNAEYAEDNYDDPGNHVDAAIFMDGIAVCDGYTRAYNLLLNAAGIDTWYVCNAIHSWNVVKIGGKAFHIDTTWDDAEHSSDKWFMRSDAEMRFADGKRDDHKTWTLTRPSELHSFQSAVLPECKDVMGDLDGDGDLDTADIKALRERLLSGEKYDIKADLDFNGRASAGDLAAAMSRMPDSGLRMGDVDGDGLVTSADASKLLDEYSLMSVSDGKTFDEKKTLVSDVNVDGQINAADASAILGYYTYISTGGMANISAYTEN